MSLKYFFNRKLILKFFHIRGDGKMLPDLLIFTELLGLHTITIYHNYQYTMTTVKVGLIRGEGAKKNSGACSPLLNIGNN